MGNLQGKSLLEKVTSEVTPSILITVLFSDMLWNENRAKLSDNQDFLYNSRDDVGGHEAEWND